MHMAKSLKKVVGLQGIELASFKFKCYQISGGQRTIKPPHIRRTPKNVSRRKTPFRSCLLDPVWFVLSRNLPVRKAELEVAKRSSKGHTSECSEILYS